MRIPGLVLLLACAAAAQEPPLAVVDLATREGAALLSATWRYRDARVVDADFRGPGADGQPTGGPVRTQTVEPRAGGADFDDSSWEAVDPPALATRRGTGRLCFGWYRVRLTVPERAGGADLTGASVVFDVSVDDYAEVWVDGEIARGLGQSGGSVVAGWNAANRLVVARDVRPGRTIQLAVFGANGPLSDPPTNFLWVRHARVEFHRGDAGPVALAPREVNVEVVRNDPAVDAIVPANPKVWKLAEGFLFTEGPVWVPAGHLFFSDPNANRIYRWHPEEGLSVFRERSGYDGADVAEYGQPGSNGLALDRDGALLACEHGNRRVTGPAGVVADRHDGRRLNSPNDLVVRSDGTVWFTDPPFGLPRFHDDPRRELPFSGVYRVSAKGVELVAKDLAGPNGLAFSPDERFLYVGNWDPARKVVMRYGIRADGTVAGSSLFFDMTAAPGEDAIDGVKVDRLGNVYVSGPGGLWILSPEGKHLGTVRAPRHVHNFAWGDADGKTLYLCARDSLYRMRLLVPGAGVRGAGGDQ